MKLNAALIIGSIVLAVLTFAVHLSIYILLFSVFLLLVGLIRAAAIDKKGDLKGHAYKRDQDRFGGGY
jgi:hypothetical protein